MRFPSRRWRLGLLAALLLVGAVALGLILAVGSSGVTEPNFEKLQVGMTPEQADDILGAENLEVVSGKAGVWLRFHYRGRGDLADLVIAVDFGPDRLAGKHWEKWPQTTEQRLQRLPMTLGQLLRGRLAKVRRRLGL